jgi:hypothetical protein
VFCLLVENGIIDKGKGLSHGLINFSTEFVGCFFVLFQSQKPGGEAGTFTVAELVSKPVGTAVSIGSYSS